MISNLVRLTLPLVNHPDGLPSRIDPERNNNNSVFKCPSSLLNKK